MRAGWVSSVLVAALLAGCTSDGPTVPPEDVAEAALATGVIRGVVVDETIRPVADAVVTIKRSGAPIVEIASDADGNFGVQNLDAGNYTVNVTKVGFLAKEIPAAVVGGDNVPPIVQVLLAADVRDQAFILALPFSGVVGCAMGANWCAVIDLYTGIKITNDASGKQFYDEFISQERTPEYVQVEVVWEPATPVGTHMSIEVWAGNWEQWETFGSQEHYGYTSFQESPMVVSINATQLASGLVGTETGIGLGLYAGCIPWPGCWAETGPPQAMVNQPFEAFLHAFYGCLPPEGWSFVAHGEATCA